ncbi:MAG: peptidoglycan-binding domain-containing protein [bacterium]|nr:peptidoglycan-binding domain-containing protein [bacterium]
MGRYMRKLVLFFVFVSLFSLVSVVFPLQTGFAEEVSFQEMFQTVQRAGQEVRALQFQTQRVLGPMLPPEEIQIVSTLRFGMRGEEVRALQELLRRDREIYPEGLVTGYFGALTENAVRRFQKAQGLNAVGIVDSWTRAYLRGFSRVAPPFLAFASVFALVSDGAATSEVNVSEESQATSTVVVAVSTSSTTVFSGGSGGGGSPTVPSSGSSGGSGGSSPAPSTSLVSTSTSLSTSTSTLASTTLSISTSTPEEQFVSTSTLSLSVASSTSTDSRSSTTVSVVSSTVVTSLDDDDADDDDDTYKKVEKDVKKAEKENEKEIKKGEKEERRGEKREKDAILERVKITIEEIVPPTARALDGTSTALRSDGGLGNLASILSSLSGLLGRMSSFFR